MDTQTSESVTITRLCGCAFRGLRWSQVSWASGETMEMLLTHLCYHCCWCIQNLFKVNKQCLTLQGERWSLVSRSVYNTLGETLVVSTVTTSKSHPWYEFFNLQLGTSINRTLYLWILSQLLDTVSNFHAFNERCWWFCAFMFFFFSLFVCLASDFLGSGTFCSNVDKSYFFL